MKSIITAITLAAVTVGVMLGLTGVFTSDWWDDPWGYQAENCASDAEGVIWKSDYADFNEECAELLGQTAEDIVADKQRADAAHEAAQLDALTIPDKPFTSIRRDTGTTATDYRRDNDLPYDWGIADLPGEHAEVVRWIDGDTVETTSGTIRLIGIDTPEIDTCIGQEAKARAESEAPAGSTVTLLNPDEVDDTDRYDRLLRYVVTHRYRSDVGYDLIFSDLGDARYDSQDGYDYHPWEEEYRAIDDPNKHGSCDGENFRASLPENENNDWFTPDNAPRVDTDTDTYNGPRCYAPGGETYVPC